MKKHHILFYSLDNVLFARVSGNRDDSDTLSDLSQAEGGAVVGPTNYLR